MNCLCGWEGVPVYRWKEYTIRGRTQTAFPPRRRHLGAYCRRCHRWIKWAAQTPETLREVSLQKEGIGERDLAETNVSQGSVGRGMW
jgi:hypothetical protein